MTASTFSPDVTVEIAFDSGFSTPAASRTWTDVSDYVEAQDAITINRGRGDELSDVAPSTCTVTLDNRDGRFTPEYASGAYYPNVKIGRPIRVSATWVLCDIAILAPQTHDFRHRELRPHNLGWARLRRG